MCWLFKRRRAAKSTSTSPSEPGLNAEKQSCTGECVLKGLKILLLTFLGCRAWAFCCENCEKKAEKKYNEIESDDADDVKLEEGLQTSGGAGNKEGISTEAEAETEAPAPAELAIKEGVIKKKSGKCANVMSEE